MKRYAFTMLELVFVIIVIGILAALSIPNTSYTPIQQAGEQVAAHIRYTQHLAMTDDKYDPTDATWYREKWQIRFRRLMSENGYVIFSDSVNTQRNADNAEIAIDPLSGERMNGFDRWDVGNLSTSYGILGTTLGVEQSCFTADGSLVTVNEGVFAFDHLGRPYSGVSNAGTPTQYRMVNDCNLTLRDNTGQRAIITVRADTGYVSVSYP
ncbi:MULTISPECIES: pilus assembly FimT family protein [unclassified Sulfuricurvum]|uniref:pilus assembly FimT family protein n=1 Tax=unclassified Sulfuricurvum TaxID=2632390 RepID=UPI00055A796D|nr:MULTISPECIES: type II secretion system protein [unclassified Sulfuricurvum]